MFNDNDGLMMGLEFDINGSELQSQVAIINKSIEEIEGNAIKAGKSLDKMPKEFNRGAKEAITRMEKINQKIKDVTKSLTPLANKSKYVFAGLATGAGLALKRYADMEAGVIKVQTISKKSFNEISNSARELSKKYGISVNEILEGNYQLVSAMGDVKEAQQVLEATTKLSLTGFTDYASAMNGLVAVMNGYKMQASDVGKVSDMLITIQNRGITTVNELQSQLGQVIPTASAVGVSFKDLGASIATMTSNKISTAQTITDLRSMLDELSQSGTKASKAFRSEAGTDFSSYLRQGHSLLEALQILERQGKKTGTAMNDIFSNTTASQAFIALMGDNVNKFKEDMQAMEQSAGATESALSKVSQETRMKFNKLKEQLNDVALKVGESLLPVFQKLLDKLESINWDKVFSQKNVDNVVDLGKKVAILAGTLWGISKALGAILTVSKAIMTGKTFFSWLAKSGSVATLAEALSSVGSLGAGALSVGALGFGAIGIPVTIAVAGYEYLKYRDKTNTKDYANLTKQNSELDKKVQLLQAMKTDVSNGVINPALYSEVVKMNGEEKAFVSKLETLQKEYEGARTDFNKQQEILAKANKEIANQISKFTTNKSNQGYLSAPIGTKMTPEEIANLKKQAMGVKAVATTTGGNSVAGLTKYGDMASPELKAFIDEYNKDFEHLARSLDILGASKQEKLRAYLNLYTSAVKKAIDLNGNKMAVAIAHQIKNVKAELDNFDKLAEDVKKNKAVASYNQNSSENLKNKDVWAGISKEITDTENLIKNLKAIDEDRYKSDIEDLEAHKSFLEKRKDAHQKEIQAIEAHSKAMIQAFNNIQTASVGFANLASATGSKRLGGIASVLGGVSSFGAFKDFKLSSITGMFSGGGSLGMFGSIAGGLAGLGTIASGIGAGIGIISSLGGLFGGNKGKKQKARIDANNKENQELYKKEVSAMERLTQAIIQNTERIKSFSDRMLVDMAKNPTLKALSGGQWNYGLYHDSMVNGKHFADINAIEKGRERYSKGWGRHGHKDTFTNVRISEGQILKYLGFDKKELDLFTAEEIKQLDGVLNQVNHSVLRKVTGRDLTQSNIEAWKQQVHVFAQQLEYLNKEKEKIFNGATLESFTGINYREEKQLIKDYTEQFAQMGLVGDHYNGIIKEMAKNNQVLVTSMLDVRNSTIDGMFNGTGGFIESSKSYFEKIFRNASSVAYDVAFSDIDRYMSDEFEEISNRLVQIKKSGKLDFNHLFDGFDFSTLTRADAIEKQTMNSLNVIKQKLFNSGVDLSIINKILPVSDFNERINDLKNVLANAMNNGIQEHSFFDFTKTLGQSLYDSTKGALVKAFSESNLYQGLIQRFISAEDFQGQLEKAGSFKDAFNLSEKIMKDFSQELEANGFGGFDAINNINRPENKEVLGNAYYSDKASNVEIKVVNNFYKDVYGLPEFQKIIADTTEDSIQKFFNKPRVLA